MPQYLFENFLSDPAQYAEAEQYWQRMFESTAALAGVAGDWSFPWLSTRFTDGSPFGDGDPIFSARSPRHGAGLRIVQLDPKPPRPVAGDDVSSWFDTFDDDEAPLHVLVVACVLTDESAERARELIRGWVSRPADIRRSKVG